MIILSITNSRSNGFYFVYVHILLVITLFNALIKFPIYKQIKHCSLINQLINHYNVIIFLGFFFCFFLIVFYNKNRKYDLATLV